MAKITIKVKATKEKKVKKEQSQHDFILLDRSGSMADRWVEALGSINTYVSELAKKSETENTKITVYAFDGHNGLQYDVLRENVGVKSFKPLTGEDSSPRGMTPLYDATVRLVATAEKRNADNTVVIIMTDGQENASKEANQLTAKAALDRIRKKGWQVIFLGADFDNKAQAFSLGNSMGQTISASGFNLSDTMATTASMRSMYAMNSAPMTYTDDDKKKALKPKSVAK